MCNIADNFVFNIDGTTQKINGNRLVDKLVSRQIAYSSKISIFYILFSRQKKLPYGSFFLRTKTFGHNTFCIASHVMKMDNFNLLNYKISNKNNKLSLMDKYYRQ